MIKITEKQRDILRDYLRNPQEFKEENYPKEDIDTLIAFVKELLVELEIRDKRLRELGMIP